MNFEQAIADLALGDQTARRRAAELLGEIRDSRAVEPLTKALADSEYSVRMAVTRALGEIGDPAATEALTRLLDDPHLDQEAATSLRKLGQTQQAGDRFLAALECPDSDVRERAMWILGWLGDRRAYEPLSRALVDEDSSVRSVAIRALGCLRDERAWGLITAFISNDDRWIRETAIIALGLFGDRRALELLTSALQEDDPIIRSSASRALAWLGDPRAIDALSSVIDDEDLEVAEWASWALQQLGDLRGVDRWVTLLADRQQAEVRRKAAECLARMAKHRATGAEVSTRAVERLVELLAAEDNPEMRCDLLKTMGEFKVPGAVERLSAYLHDSSSAVRSACVTALRRSGDRQAIVPLVRALGDDDCLVQLNIQRALKALGGDRPLDYWTGVLQAPDPESRMRAIEVIARLDDLDAVEPLGGLLRDPSPEVRCCCVWALASFHQRRAVEHLLTALADEDPSVSLAAACSIERMHQANHLDSVDLLAESLLSSSNVRARQSCARILERINDRRAIRPLIEALGDEDPSVREQAESALRSLRHCYEAEACEFWCHRLKAAAAPLRTVACKVLAEIRHPDAINSLIVAVQDGDPELSTSAVEALREFGDSVELPLQEAALKADAERRAIILSATRLLGFVPLEICEVTEDGPKSAQLKSILDSAFAGGHPAEVLSLDDDDHGISRRTLALALYRRGWWPTTIGERNAFYRALGLWDVLVLIEPDRHIASLVIEGRWRALAEIGERGTKALIMCRRWDYLEKQGRAAIPALLAFCGQQGDRWGRTGDGWHAYQGLPDSGKMEREEYFAVLRLLGRIGDERAIPYLLRKLRSAYDVHQTLLKYGEKDELLSAIACIGRPAVPSLLNALQVIDRVGYPSSRAEYVDVWQRCAIISVLGDIGDKAAVPALLEELKHGRFKYSAIEALGKLRDERAVPVLLPLLERIRINPLDTQEDSPAYHYYNLIADALHRLGHPAGDDVYEFHECRVYLADDDPRRHCYPDPQIWEWHREWIKMPR